MSSWTTINRKLTACVWRMELLPSNYSRKICLPCYCQPFAPLQLIVSVSLLLLDLIYFLCALMRFFASSFISNHLPSPRTQFFDQQRQHSQRSVTSLQATGRMYTTYVSWVEIFANCWSPGVCCQFTIHWCSGSTNRIVFTTRSEFPTTFTSLLSDIVHNREILLYL